MGGEGCFLSRSPLFAAVGPRDLPQTKFLLEMPISLNQIWFLLEMPLFGFYSIISLDRIYLLRHGRLGRSATLGRFL